jgi:hypothetical protein
LWIRETGDATRALKAMNLVLQAGGFGLVALDLVDVQRSVLQGLPFTTWFRLSRTIDGSQTVALLIGFEHLARSPGGATIALEDSTSLWAGESDRARLLRGLDLRPRVIGRVLNCELEISSSRAAPITRAASANSRAGPVGRTVSADKISYESSG